MQRAGDFLARTNRRDLSLGFAQSGGDGARGDRSKREQRRLRRRRHRPFHRVAQDALADEARNRGHRRRDQPTPRSPHHRSGDDARRRPGPRQRLLTRRVVDDTIEQQKAGAHGDFENHEPPRERSRRIAGGASRRERGDRGRDRQCSDRRPAMVELITLKDEANPGPQQRSPSESRNASRHATIEGESVVNHLHTVRRDRPPLALLSYADVSVGRSAPSQTSSAPPPRPQPPQRSPTHRGRLTPINLNR